MELYFTAGLASLLCLCSWGFSPAVKAETAQINELFNMSLEDLMETEITSATKRSQSLLRTAAATYVISEEDIRRSGVSTIPEVLRIVPGISVAQIDANKWAISSRGFNDLYSKYLLVLIDGRSIYTPTSSSVHWNTLDYPLEDIKRIEVIKGPGAALWGANAVNGVINIITKRASETRGIAVSIETGNKQKILSARHGGKISQTGRYRFYVKAREENSSASTSTHSENDNWDMFHTGFRVDWRKYYEDAFTLQGDFYSGTEGTTLNYPTTTPPFSAVDVASTETSGLNFLARWTKTYSSTSEWTLQSYYNQHEREEIVTNDRPSQETHETIDIDFQHRIQTLFHQQIVWGLNLRYIRETRRQSFRFSLFDNNSTTIQVGAFVQDEISLIDKRLSAILGGKVEYFELAGIEFQPNARLMWTPTPTHTIWASVAQAMRNPTKVEQEAKINTAVYPGDQCNNGNLCVIQYQGNRDINPEKLNAAYEIGFRSAITHTFSYDLALFYNQYTNLISSEKKAQYASNEFGVPVEIIPHQFVNDTKGTTRGLELSSMWQASSAWRLLAGLSILDMNIETTNNFDINRASPRKQFNLRSYYNFSPNIEFDTLAYFVSDLSIVTKNPEKTEYVLKTIEKYWRLDLRLAWTPRKTSSAVLGVRNLLDRVHREFSNSPFIIANEVKRNFYLKLTQYF